MTIGTLLLGVLEPQRALSSEVSYLAATYGNCPAPEVTRTDDPIEPALWRRVVIHRGIGRLELPCLTDKKGRVPEAHFGIGRDGRIVMGRLWQRQESVPGAKSGSIHIVVNVDRQRPQATLHQAERLVSLIMELQARCRISPAHVYLHSQLSTTNCPGRLLRRYNWRGSLLGVVDRQADEL